MHIDWVPFKTIFILDDFKGSIIHTHKQKVSFLVQKQRAWVGLALNLSYILMLSKVSNQYLIPAVNTCNQQILLQLRKNCLNISGFIFTHLLSHFPYLLVLSIEFELIHCVIFNFSYVFQLLFNYDRIIWLETLSLENTNETMTCSREPNMKRIKEIDIQAYHRMANLCYFLCMHSKLLPLFNIDNKHFSKRVSNENISPRPEKFKLCDCLQ